MADRRLIQQDANPENLPIFPENVNAFNRVSVDYLIKGGSRIRWEMARHFNKPLPHTFQLQTSYGVVAESDDWTNVGSPVVNTFFALDDERRLYGKYRHISYRVKLTDGNAAVYYSKPALTLGQWTKHDWILAREVIRKETLRAKRFTSVEGYLFKKRRYGDPCTDCTDPITGEITNSDCSECGGTGILLGYYDPVPTFYADMTNEDSEEHRDNQMRATIHDVMVRARFFDFPPLAQNDVWVNRFSDERYFVHRVTEIGSHRGVPIIWTVELRKAEDTDNIYSDPIFDIPAK